ncbi:MAG: NAD(P)-dependent oxidoreductase, partial [Microthrixaceae bacterium]
MEGSGGKELLAVGPAGAPAWMAEAVRAGGGRVVPAERARAVLWADPDDPAGLRRLLDLHGDHLEWVQLPWAGVEPYVSVMDAERIWTCGKGAYAEPVAEMALTLALAGMRGLGRYARSARWREAGALGTNLAGARVTVLGGGGITEVLLRLLGPFDCDVTVVRTRPSEMPGATRVMGPDRLDAALEERDLVVLALALTPANRGVIDAGRLALLTPSSWLVNVARGAHVVTDDLVDALTDGRLGGAGLDVTDPEPLPDGHPLWSLPNCIVTPHVGNTPEMARPLLADRITENVSRWIAGQPLVGP